MTVLAKENQIKTSINCKVDKIVYVDFWKCRRQFGGHFIQSSNEGSFICAVTFLKTNCPDPFADKMRDGSASVQ